MSGKYAPLGCLVQTLGASSILTICPSITQHLLDHVGKEQLGPYVSLEDEYLFVASRFFAL